MVKTRKAFHSPSIIQFLACSALTKTPFLYLQVSKLPFIVMLILSVTQIAPGINVARVSSSLSRVLDDKDGLHVFGATRSKSGLFHSTKARLGG